MSVLIKGMKLPEKRAVLVRTQPNAEAIVYEDEPYETDVEELSAHGRLIDADAFETDIRSRYCHTCDNYNGLKCKACWVDDMLGEVDDASTIVPAEGGTYNGNQRRTFCSGAPD